MHSYVPSVGILLGILIRRSYFPLPQGSVYMGLGGREGGVIREGTGLLSTLVFKQSRAGSV